MTDIDNLKYFDEKYVISSLFYISQLEEKTVVPDTITNQRTCRFCGKSSPETTFRKDAHAIPEFLGNRYLLSDAECDSCNDYFSKTVEDHFAKFLNPYRTIGQIPGKTGLPKYKSPDKKSRIDFEESSFSIHSPSDDPIFFIDQPNKLLHTELKPQPFVPCIAFKLFVKIAISIAPSTTLSDYSSLIAWLMDRNIENLSAPSKPLIVLYQFTPGQHPYPGLDVFLLRRNPNAPPVPDCILILAFGNLCLQAYIPMPTDKTLDGKKQNLVFFPIPFDGHIQSTKRPLDFSSTTPETQSVQKFTSGFEHAERKQ